jgi:hypothetical protein
LSYAALRFSVEKSLLDASTKSKQGRGQIGGASFDENRDAKGPTLFVSGAPIEKSQHVGKCR